MAQEPLREMGVPVLDAPQGRRDDFVDPYFKRAKTDEVVVILKAREPARIMIAIGGSFLSPGARSSHPEQGVDRSAYQ